MAALLRRHSNFVMNPLFLEGLSRNTGAYVCPLAGFPCPLSCIVRDRLKVRDGSLLRYVRFNLYMKHFKPLIRLRVSKPLRDKAFAMVRCTSLGYRVSSYGTEGVWIWGDGVSLWGYECGGMG